ncbi:hypothetical protein [Sphingopyxis sp. YF1]|uniref:hypothetical protein n=1 Tax=Sphingopyxis sp. YF1 TaxID=2482763 RepID=UPI002417C69E|nr:hypothetical protein [Sphingopyxis sp. YF1]
MKKLILLATATFIATPATAAPLWQNVEAGMTVKEVMRLYPKANRKSKYVEIKKYEPIRGCKSEVRVMLDAGVVDSVVVTGEDKKCADRLYSALIGKYGRPAHRIDGEAGGSGGGGGLLGRITGGVVNQALGAAGVPQGAGGLLGGDGGLGELGGATAMNAVGGMLGGGGGRGDGALMWSIDGTILRFERDGGDWEMSYLPTANIGL